MSSKGLDDERNESLGHCDPGYGESCDRPLDARLGQIGIVWNRVRVERVNESLASGTHGWFDASVSHNTYDNNVAATHDCHTWLCGCAAQFGQGAVSRQHNDA